MTRWLTKRTAFVFGAGATRACGGPLTAEILPSAFGPDFRERMKKPELAEEFEQCLIRHFHVPPDPRGRTNADYPPLPLVLSLLDLVIERDRPLTYSAVNGGASPDHWSRERLSRAREEVEYVVFEVLNEHLRTVKQNWYEALFDLTVPFGFEPWAISLNYDILLDNVLFKLAWERPGGSARPAYGCDIRTPAYRDIGDEYGRLLKLHGSLHWMYCPCCHGLEIGMSECGIIAVSCSSLKRIHNQFSLDEHYGETAKPCSDCGTPLRPVLITPTRAKDYRNPHIQSTWYHAEKLLRQAEHVCFIGYSLPDDDIEVIDLLRRSLWHLTPDCITVVEYVSDKEAERREIEKNPVGRRYQSIFGRGIDWHWQGFGEWVTAAGAARVAL
jgi:hypothetical protein